MNFIAPSRRLCLLSLLFAGLCAHAQHGGGMGPGGGGGMGPGGGAGGIGRGMGMPGGDMRRGGMGMPSTSGTVPGNSIPRGTPPPSSGGTASSMRGGLQLGPPGRWWDDKKFAKSLGLNSDQQKRMDGIFGQNREALLSRYENLQRAESRLESLTRSGKLSESALFSEIDRVAQARAELEKANTHYLLQIREEMTADQLNRLEEHR